MNCPGSVQAEDEFLKAHPETETTSVFAEEGSRAHEVAEQTLNVMRDEPHMSASMFEGQVVRGEVVSTEMCDYVQEYVDYICDISNDENAVILVEERVSLEPVVPGGFGTCDVILMDKDGINIVDLKYGKGVRVDATNNTQLMLYALGFVLESRAIYDFPDEMKVILHIAQPRLHHFDTWGITVADLLLWGNDVAAMAQAALQPNAPRIAGDSQCRWCKAKPNCRALQQHTEKVIGADFDELESIADIETLTRSEMRRILDGAGLITDYIKAVREHAFREIIAGKPFDGYKVVEGRSNRKWKPEAEDELVKHLGDDAYSKKLLGVTEASKKLGKDVVAPLLTKPRGAPTLAPESDKRDSYTPDATDDFDAV